ncbi:EthD family reductase [Chitinophaga sp. Hz27]|uniref:EthD family reductase n=1 Tax=Chitinophaga sp. Hz27 TaxID=3347169 RepID=UPI0035DD0441
MVKLTVMYPNLPDTSFNMHYYLHTHMELVKSKLGNYLKGFMVEEGITGDVSPDSKPGDNKVPAPFVVIANLFFNSIEDLYQSFMPNLEVLVADCPNFTDINVKIQISRVTGFYMQSTMV